MKINPPVGLLTFALVTLAAVSSQAGPPVQKEVKELVAPPPADSWEFKIGVPAWIAATQGDAGINGVTSHTKTGFNEIANKLDLVGALRIEASKGRFGIRADFSYFSLSDGKAQDGIVKKVDTRADETLGDLGFHWRLINAERGSLDVIAGVRYTYMYEEVGLQGNNQVIGAAANRLAQAGTLLRLAVAGELAALRGQDGERFGRPGLAAGDTERLIREIAAIRGNQGERAEKIEKALRKALNRRVSRTDQWFDPYIGLQGRFDLTEECYLLARADVSPFDVGADFAWQASAGFGLKLSPRVSSELVYRILDVDYRHDGLIYDTTAHGPELTLSLHF